MQQGLSHGSFNKHYRKERDLLVISLSNSIYTLLCSIVSEYYTNNQRFWQTFEAYIYGKQNLLTYKTYQEKIIKNFKLVDMDTVQSMPVIPKWRNMPLWRKMDHTPNCTWACFLAEIISVALFPHLLLDGVLLLYHPHPDIHTCCIFEKCVYSLWFCISAQDLPNTLWSTILKWKNLHTYFHFGGQWGSGSACVCLCVCVCSRVCSNVKVSQDPIDSALFLFAWWLQWGLTLKPFLWLCTLCFVRTCKQLCACVCVCLYNNVSVPNKS